MGEIIFFLTLRSSDRVSYQCISSCSNKGLPFSPVFAVYVIVFRRGIHGTPRTARKGSRFFRKLSVRNQLKGTVAEMNEGAVNAIVKIDIGGGNVISAAISMASVKELGQGSLCRHQSHLRHGGYRRLSAHWRSIFGRFSRHFSVNLENSPIHPGQNMVY